MYIFINFLKNDIITTCSSVDAIEMEDNREIEILNWKCLDYFGTFYQIQFHQIEMQQIQY